MRLRAFTTDIFFRRRIKRTVDAHQLRHLVREVGRLHRAQVHLDRPLPQGLQKLDDVFSEWQIPNDDFKVLIDSLHLGLVEKLLGRDFDGERVANGILQIDGMNDI